MEFMWNNHFLILKDLERFPKLRADTLEGLISLKIKLTSRIFSKSTSIKLMKKSSCSINNSNNSHKSKDSHRKFKSRESNHPLCLRGLAIISNWFLLRPNVPTILKASRSQFNLVVSLATKLRRNWIKWWYKSNRNSIWIIKVSTFKKLQILKEETSNLHLPMRRMTLERGQTLGGKMDRTIRQISETRLLSTEISPHLREKSHQVRTKLFSKGACKWQKTQLIRSQCLTNIVTKINKGLSQSIQMGQTKPYLFVPRRISGSFNSR